MSKSQTNVIVIDSDALLLNMYGKQLSARYDVFPARHAQEALDLLDQHGAAVIVTDMMIGRNNGIEILHELRSYDDWSKIPIVVLSSLPEKAYQPVVWSRYNVASFHFKPQTSPKQLLYAVNDALTAYGA